MSTGIAHEGMVRSGGDRPVPLPVQALDHATGYLMAAAAALGLASGMGSRTRVSLARTAALLIGAGADAPRDAAPWTASEDDYGPEREITGWGAMRRLKPPAAVGPAALSWDCAAAPLGSAQASWLGAA